MKFTIGTNPGIIVTEELIKLVQNHKDILNDIFFTFRLEPFVTDAYMILTTETLNEIHVYDMLKLQEKSGVTVTGTFNNILVSSTKETLEIFVKNLKPYYEGGLRSIIVPHQLWMYFGLLQKEYPDMIFKTTVLRRCLSAQDYWNFAKAGFDNVMLDRSLIRNFNELEKIKKAQTVFYKQYGKYVKTTLLMLEGCQPNCPFWEEHYHHSLSIDNVGLNKNDFDQLFTLPQTYSCARHRCKFSAMVLPILKDHLCFLFNNIDIFKMGGRRQGEDTNMISYNIEVANNIIKLEQLDDPIIKYYHNLNYDILNILKETKLFKTWSNHITNCKGQCYNCNLCERIEMIYNNIISKQMAL